MLARRICWLTSIKSASQLYAVLSDTDVVPICDLFNNYRPDLAIVDCNSIHILELTVCHETNFVSSHEYKSHKYKNISSCSSSLAGNRKIVPHFIEVSTLGFISNCSDFINAVKIDAMPAALKHNIVKSAIKSSFDIYCKRKSAEPIAA